MTDAPEGAAHLHCTTQSRLSKGGRGQLVPDSIQIAKFAKTDLVWFKGLILPEATPELLRKGLNRPNKC